MDSHVHLQFKSTIIKIDKGQVSWQRTNVLTNENFADKGQGQIKDKILTKDMYSDKRQILWQMTNAVTNDKYCDKGQLIDWKQSNDKELHKILLLHMFLTKRLLPFKDAGHLTKDSHTLLHGNKIESAFKLFNK